MRNFGCMHILCEVRKGVRKSACEGSPSLVLNTFLRKVYSSKQFFFHTLVYTSILAMPITKAHGALLASNLFPADNPWNQNISQAPVATNSAAIIIKIGNGRFHPDFGQDYRTGNPLYGIPYNVVH